MARIELTQDEIKVIKMYFDGQVEVWEQDDYVKNNLNSVISKAEALEEELGEQDYDDMIKWFWDKYQEQNCNG